MNVALATVATAVLAALVVARVAAPRRAPVSVPVPAGAVSLRAGRRRAGDDGAVAELLEQVARELRGGEALIAAVERAVGAPRAPLPFRPVRLALSRGASLHDALTRVSTSAGRGGPVDGDVVTAVQVLAACAEVGGPAAEPIDRAAAVLRERAAARAERRAHAAQALLSARLLAGLPVVYAVWGAATDAQLRSVYLHAPVAQASVAAGLAAAAVGWAWMRRLVEGER